jgi:hypothetical protein
MNNIAICSGILFTLIARYDRVQQCLEGSTGTGDG